MPISLQRAFLSIDEGNLVEKGENVKDLRKRILYLKPRPSCWVTTLDFTLIAPRDQ